MVEGYVYTNLDSDRANQIVQIVGRGPTKPELGNHPNFVIEFEDGTKTETLDVYLRPWFSVCT